MGRMKLDQAVGEKCELLVHGAMDGNCGHHEDDGRKGCCSPREEQRGDLPQPPRRRPAFLPEEDVVREGSCKSLLQACPLCNEASTLMCMVITPEWRQLPALSTPQPPLRERCYQVPSTATPRPCYFYHTALTAHTHLPSQS